MAGPALIPPELPKLPVALPTPYDPALQSVVVALRAYMELRHSYQRAARTLLNHDAEVRQQERLQHELAERQVSLTARVKRRLVREHSARAGNAPGPSGETTEALAQRLFMELHTRESTQASVTPASQAPSRFSVMSMMTGTVRASRLSRAQPRSEHAFASLLDARRTAAEIDGRLNELNQRSGSVLADTQRSFRNAADAFANIAAALNDVDRTLPDLSNSDRRILRTLDVLIASARIGVTAGQSTIDAHRRARQDDRTLTISSRGSTVRAVTPEPAVLPEFNDLQYPGIRESIPLFMQMPTPAQCIAAAANVTPQTSLTQDANIAAGTARQRVDGLAISLAGYHENVGVLRRHLRENVLAIQAYAAQPGDDTMSAVGNTRSSLEAHLQVVRNAVGDVSNRCADVRQIQDPGVLRFAQQTADTIGRIDSKLEREIERNRAQQDRAQVPERRIDELRYPELTAAMKLLELMPGKQACLAATHQIAERTLLKPNASNQDRTPPQRVERLADALEGYETQVRILESRLARNESATKNYGDEPHDSTLNIVKGSRAAVEQQLKAVGAACTNVKQEWARFKEIEGTESLEFTKYMKEVVGRIDHQLEREILRNRARGVDLNQFDAQFRERRQHLSPPEQQDVVTSPDNRIAPARHRSEVRARIEIPPSRQPLRIKAGRTLKG